MLLQATRKEIKFIKKELLRFKNIFEIELLDDNVNQDHIYEASTLLHIAAKYGRCEELHYLLSDGLHVDSINKYGSTPLHIGVYYKHTDIVKLLISFNSDIFIQNKNAKCPADLGLLSSRCIQSLFFEQLKELYGNNSISIAEKLLDLNSSLASAAQFGNPLILSHMIERGRDVNERDENDSYFTALHYAVILQKVDVLKILLLHRCDPNVKDGNEKTPLCYINVEDKTYSNILQMMIDNGGCISTKVASSTTFLENACNRGCFEIIQLICNYNEELKVRGEETLNLLKNLISNPNREMIDIFFNYNWNFQTLRQPISLFHCVIYGHPHTLNYMLRKGVRLDSLINDCNILTILSSQSIKERQKLNIEDNLSECSRYLLYHGADPQQILEDRTIFYWIVRNDNWTLANNVLGHLALMEVLGLPINELITKDIENNDRLRKHFKKYVASIKNTKKIILFESITAFKFLTETERTIINYARNAKIVKSLKKFLNSQNSDMYHVNVLNDRFTYCKYRVEVESKLYQIVLNFPYLKANTLVASYIVSFFDIFELVKFNELCD